MPFVVLKRDKTQNWADVYGLFQRKQDALDHVESIRDNEKYKYYVTEANDQELEKAIAIKAANSVFNAVEHLGVRDIYKK